jgi:hypothetical protein
VFLGLLLSFEQSTVVDGDRVFPSQHTQQVASVISTHNGKLIEIQFREALHGCIQVIVGNNVDDIRGHNVAGDGQFPERVVIQVRSNIVCGKDPDQAILRIDYRKVILE